LLGAVVGDLDGQFLLGVAEPEVDRALAMADGVGDDFRGEQKCCVL